MEYIFAYRIYYGTMKIEQVLPNKKEATIRVLQETYNYVSQEQETIT